MTELLQVSGLRAGYGRGDVVSGIDFALGPGTLCALLGANGSGKSTLLRAVVGLLPYGGSCLLAGEELAAMPHRRQARAIGYLAQRGGQPLALSALDVVLMGYNPVLGPLESPTAAQRSHALAVMAQVEADLYAHADYHTLSEGQRQLVLVARTLVRELALVALDEPDSALDHANRHRVMGVLRARVQAGRCAALMSSHDVNFALRYADRLLLLEAGRLIHDVDLAAVSQQALAAALRDVYGPVEVLRHRGYYVMMG